MFDYYLKFDWLAEALAKTLAAFPYLAGRISRYSRSQLKTLEHNLPYFICLNNSGVPLTEANSTLRVSDLGLKALAPSGFSYLSRKCDLPPWFDRVSIGSVLSGKDPIMQVRYAFCHVVALLLTELLCEQSLEFWRQLHDSCMYAYM